MSGLCKEGQDAHPRLLLPPVEGLQSQGCGWGEAPSRFVQNVVHEFHHLLRAHDIPDPVRGKHLSTPGPIFLDALLNRHEYPREIAHFPTPTVSLPIAGVGAPPSHLLELGLSLAPCLPPTVQVEATGILAPLTRPLPALPLLAPYPQSSNRSPGRSRLCQWHSQRSGRRTGTLKVLTFPGRRLEVCRNLLSAEQMPSGSRVWFWRSVDRTPVAGLEVCGRTGGLWTGGLWTGGLWQDWRIVAQRTRSWKRCSESELSKRKGSGEQYQETPAMKAFAKNRSNKCNTSRKCVGKLRQM